MSNSILFLPLISILATLQVSHAVVYTVTNGAPSTPSGIRFTNEIGVEYAKQTLISATKFIWKTFQQNFVAERKNISRVSFFIDRFSYYSDSEIHISVDDIASYEGDVRTETTGDLHHAMTHLWQWKGTSQAPVLIQIQIQKCTNSKKGGIRFNDEVGVEYTKQALRSATDFIWKVFQQSSVAERKNITQVTLFIEEEGGYTTDNEIHFRADYIASFSGGDVRTGVTGELYHVMTHIWQWKGTSLAPAPGGLEQGIADFVRLKAGYAEGNWALPGKGNRWDEGYDVTARFLDYCDSLKKNGFVAELNKKMRDGYSPDYFVDLLGKTADQLWGEYKAQHRGKFLLYCEA